MEILHQGGFGRFEWLMLVIITVLPPKLFLFYVRLDVKVYSQAA